MSSHPQAAQGERGSQLAGVRFVFAAYLLYAVGDAAAKWLVGSISVWEVLFVRSALGLVLCLAIGGRPAITALLQVPRRTDLYGMNLANFCAWSAYYSAAVHLPLPQLYTAYYLSPIFAALLAGPMLGERIRAFSWFAGALGFLGVIVTTSPWSGPRPALVPLLLGVTAALMWALSSILYRRSVHGSSKMELVVTSNVSVGLLSAVPLAGHWQAMAPNQYGVLLVVVAAGLAAHFLYISGVRRASVAVAGPIGFFSLIWSALLAYLVWDELPVPGMLIGGCLILLAGLLVVHGEWRKARRAT